MEGLWGRGPCSYFKWVYYSSICIRVQRIQWHKHLERSNYGTSRPKIPSCPPLLVVVHRASEGTMLFAFWPEVVGWHSTSQGHWKFLFLRRFLQGVTDEEAGFARVLLRPICLSSQLRRLCEHTTHAQSQLELGGVWCGVISKKYSYSSFLQTAWVK